MPAHAFLPAFLVAVAAAAAAAPGPVSASPSPCEAPDAFVRRTGAESAPLSRPYVVAGLAAVSLRGDGSHRWLELAVNSADDARRRLSSAREQAGRGAADADAPVVETWRERVWLRCPTQA